MACAVDEIPGKLFPPNRINFWIVPFAARRLMLRAFILVSQIFAPLFLLLLLNLFWYYLMWRIMIRSVSSRCYRLLSRLSLQLRPLLTRAPFRPL